MALNPEFFSKIDYSFAGIFRGVVEDNNDPLDAGRVRVRIFSIHNFDGKITPVEQLPWAEPALSLAWSGGHNVYNKDYKPEDQRNAIKDGRYNVGNDVPVNGTDKTVASFPILPDAEFIDARKDAVSNACGTGGNFVVPKRGNWVFLFFEGGNHDKPIYFAMAPNARDWTATKSWRTMELDAKVQQITEFKKEFTPREGIKATNDSWAKNAVVNTLVAKPDLAIEVPNAAGGEDTTNRDIQCMTSANGTTIIIDQRNGAEQIFVIHKNYMEYTDKFGNRKIYVGKKRDVDFLPTNSDLDEPCHYEVGVEGNHELHVLGNYDVYAKGRVHIQCDSHAQIDVMNSVGITVREGDVDLIVQKGNVNADIAGNVDAEIGYNLNAHIKKNSNIRVDGDCKMTVGGNMDTLVEKDFKLTARNIDMVATSNLSITTGQNVNVDTTTMKISDNVHITNNLLINNQTDISGRTRIANQLIVATGIECGGYLRNRGEANLGSPVIAHGLQVVGGNGTGTAASARRGENPDSAEKAARAERVDGITVQKPYSGKPDGDPDPYKLSDLVYNRPR